jgi:hypothetical protein
LRQPEANGPLESAVRVPGRQVVHHRDHRLATGGGEVAGPCGRAVDGLALAGTRADGDHDALPLGLWTFQYSITVPAVLASVVLTTLPILILYAVGWRQLLRGLAAGFSK